MNRTSTLSHLSRLALALLTLVVTAAAANAEPVKGYYDRVDGLQKTALKKGLRSIIATHDKLSYSSQLPDAYPYVYYVDGGEVGTKYATVYDLFSDEVYLYSSTSKWNKEHVVPKSWWGSSTSAAQGCDLISVIPSDPKANSAKSNYPPGIVNKSSTKTKDFGRIWVGPATDGTGGSFSSVWEPYDEYKGDFARILMYVATCYGNISWDSTGEFNKDSDEWPTMEPWLYKLMLKWHNADPVSDKEKQINDNIYKQQGNRNPFIDYPVLADMIWGDRTNESFDLSSAVLYAHTGGGGNVYNEWHVTYDANGGAGAPDQQTSVEGGVTISLDVPSREGYTFNGWNTMADGSGVAYVPGSTASLTGNITLFAQWRKVGGGVTIGTGDWYQVTSAADLATAGKFLVVYESASVALNGALAEKLDVASNTISVTIDDHTIAASDDAEKAAFTFNPADGSFCSTTGHYFGRTKNDNGLDVATSPFANTVTLDGSDVDIVCAAGAHLRFNNASNQNRFRYYKSGTYAAQKAIQLYRQHPAGCTLDITSLGYATLYLNFGVQLPEGLTAYTATTEGKTVVLTAIAGGKVPADTPVLIEGAEGSYMLTVADCPSLNQANEFRGVLTDTPFAALIASCEYDMAYVLNTGSIGTGFYALASTATLGAHRVWLPVDSNIFDDPDEALSFRIGTTSVRLIEGNTQQPAIYYDLTGRRVEHPTHGIYICNGKKVYK